MCNCKCFYSSVNNFMRVWTDLCNRKCSYEAGNNFMQVWTDVCEILLCSWKQFCASWVRSMQKEMLIYRWKQFYARFDSFGQICATGITLMLLETILHEFGQICATGNSPIVLYSWNDFMRVWTNLCYREWFCETNFHYKISRQKFEQKCAEPFYVVMTHSAAKANLEKGSSWPPEAKQKVQSYVMGLVLKSNLPSINI